MDKGTDKFQATAIILLAAGSSSRLGKSKQLLDIHGKSLLAHSTMVAMQSGLKSIVIVLGANETEHRAAIQQFDIDVVMNRDWQKGMGSSIKTGLNYLLSKVPSLESVIVMVCDQPLLTPDHLKKVYLEHLETKKRIVASFYDGKPGVPALFDKSLFLEIMNLPDDQGAKALIRQHPSEASSIDFPDGASDLDTLEDYDRFVRRAKNAN